MCKIFYLSGFFSRFRMGEFLYPFQTSFPYLGRMNFCIPSHQNWQIFVSLSDFFSRFTMGEFLYPSLTKIEKCLYHSQFSFPDLGWAKFCISYCFFSDLGWMGFVSLSYWNWHIFVPLSWFLYRFGIRISIDQSSYTSIENSRTFPITSVRVGIFDREF